MKKVFLIVIAAGVFGYAAYELLMYYDNEFIYGRMRETPAVRPYEEPILIMETGLVPLSGGDAIYPALDGKTLKSPYPKIEAAILAQGKKGYFTYCAQCHGKYHDGKGTVGQSFAPLPGDLRSQKVQALPEGLIFQEISYGIPDGRQPALATTISLEDRWKIIAYIKSLGVRK
jgi:mono/diheme cytochrome c family protein